MRDDADCNVTLNPNDFCATRSVRRRKLYKTHYQTITIYLVDYSVPESRLAVAVSPLPENFPSSAGCQCQSQEDVKKRTITIITLYKSCEF